MYKVLINKIIQYKTRLISHTPTCDNVKSQETITFSVHIINLKPNYLTNIVLLGCQARALIAHLLAKVSAQLHVVSASSIPLCVSHT
jgi:hypothetical protein